MSKAYAKTRAEEKKKNSSASSQQSSYEKSVQIYNQQKELDIQAAKRASENFTRASTYNQYNSNLRAYMDRLNALRGYGYNTSTPMAQVQQEIKRIQPDLQQENRYMQALQEQRELERRKREARNSQPWAVRVGLVNPNEAEMTFGVYDPSASERGRLSNVLAAGGKGWLAGQQNALGFALDPSQPDEAEMFFGKAPTSKLGEKISGKINEALFNQSQRLYGASDELNRQALEHETAAKKGLGKFGQTLVDVGMAGAQMALDAGIGAATGTGMASMGTRTFGQSAREALDSGATYQQAMDYGMGSAAVELGTEKMFDVAKIFGGGGLDKTIEKWIVKYAKTPAGMTILRTIASASGEGLEEIISSAVNPLLRSGYDPNALQDYKTADYWTDMLHEGLVGALLGGVGVAGNVITGGNARMVNEVNQEALQQRLQRADAFNEAQRKLFAGNTMQTGTADAEAARVLNRNSGTQGARDRAAVRTAAREQYGEQAKAVESVFEAGTADAETFQRQFQTAYDLGKEGAALDVVMNTPATADLNELQRENAWAIGRDAGIREGTIKEEANENVETVRVRGSGERDAGQSAAGQVQQVEGSAGSYQEGRSLGVGRNAKDSAAADLRYSEEVKSARDLGIENGAVIKNLRTVDESSYTPEMREYAQEQAANGHKVTFVSGLIHAQDGPGGMITRARGMVNGNGDVIIQADNERFTALQIGRHEDGHLRIARGEIDLAATKEAVRESMGQERFDRAMQDYAEAYAGLDMTADEIWEEIVCDAQGEMNIFEGTLMQNAEQRASELIRETKKASQETAREGETRAPPEGGQKMSAELTDKQEQALDSVGVEIDSETESANPGEVFFSRETWDASEYVQRRDAAVSALVKALGVSEAQAEKYIDDVNSVAYMIANEKGRLDYEATGMSPFVSNSEYGGSFDFTTLCKKRRLITGTFSAIQNALPNTALTPLEILEIRRMMDEQGLEVNCGKCYVEGSRAAMGKFTKEFLRLYAKYHPGKFVPNMAQMNTPDGVEWVRQNHPEVYSEYLAFWNNHGKLRDGDPNLFASQQKPKLYQMRSAYDGEILKAFKGDKKIKEKNDNGGLRVQSFSDFEIVHLIDMMQVIMDASREGLYMQGYTKVQDFARAFGNTGLKINLSIDAWGVDENGKLIFNDKEGMPTKDAFELREKYSENVGTICCVYDDAQLLAALADPRIDFIIPFHRSQWKKSQYKAMGMPKTTKDYTYQQNEKWLHPEKHTHEYRGRQVQTKCTNFMPNTYWDFNKSGKENAEKYLRMCAEAGKRPKFYKFLVNNGDGSYSLQPDGSTDGYWKLLIDFKMYDNEGNGAKQRPVRPDFNMDEINRMLKSYEGGHNRFPVAQGIVDEFVSKYKAEHKGQKFSRELNLDEQRERLSAMQNEYNEAERTRKELQKAPEFQQFMERIKSASNEEIPRIAAEYKEWEVKSGLGEAVRTSERLRGEIATLRGQIQRAEREALESAREEYRKKFTPEFAAKYAAKAARKFGTTSRFGLAGYLTTNGTLLDFSEGQGYRVQDHREIAEVLDFLPEDHEYSDGMIEFMNLGNIRLQSYGIDISKMPNAKQAPVLRRFFNSLDGEVTVDFSKENGNTDGSIDYPEGTRADRILADIKRYFETGEVPELSTTQQFHFSRELDDEYLTAVRSGDTEKAQRMVDEAAKAAGYDSPKLYHGTKAFGFTVFSDPKKVGYFFTDSVAVASTYSGKENETAVSKKVRKGKDGARRGNYAVYLKMDKPLTIDCQFHNWDDIPISAEESDRGKFYGLVLNNEYATGRYVYTTTDNVVEFAKKNGYDGVIFEDVRDNSSENPKYIPAHMGGKGQKLGANNVYAVLESEQIKSADPVTYDEDGNIIPLSERFNPEQTDIRFSRETDIDQLARENQRLKREIERWRSELKTTNRGREELRERDVRAAAKSLIERTDSTLSVDDIMPEMQALGNYLIRGERNERRLSWTEAERQAGIIAAKLVDSAQAMVEESDPALYRRVKSYLNGQKIAVPDNYKNDLDGGYAEFRKAHPALNLSKNGLDVDTVYQEMQNMFGKGLFPDDIRDRESGYESSDPAAMLQQIADVVEGLEPIYENPHSYHREEALAWAENLTIDSLMSSDVRQRKTKADKFYEKARKKNEEWRKRELAKLKNQFREKEQRARERREEREGINKYRKRVEQKAKQLGDWLLKNSAKEHIPENLKKPVAEFLATIDFTSKRQLKGGTETQKDKRFAERLRALTSTLEKMQSGGAEDSLDSVRQHEGLPPYYMEFLKMLSDKAVTAMENGDVYTINQMTAAELKTLDETITAIVKTIRMMNRLYENGRAANAQALGFETIEEMDRLGAKKARGERGDAVRSFFAWDNTNPFYAFKRLGSAAASVFEEIQNGWDRFAFNVIKIMDFTKEAYTSKEVRDWGETVHEFTLESGDKVYMTTAQIMSLRMLLRREQAVQHIQGGGVRIDDIDAKGKGNKHLQAEHYHLTAKDIDQIAGTLTERQREVANKLQKFMQEQGGEWGNHVSRARWDIDFFGEENYFPIVTEDSDRNAIDPEARANDLFRLLNMGATKSLNPNANNALVIRDIFDVFADHMTDMAKYDGLALPILDAMKWLNYRYREETSYDAETGKSEYRSHTVQRAIEKAYGKEALRYLTTFMRDLNGVNESTGRGEGFARKMISNYKVAAVAANLRVALLQPTSYFRALYAINGRYLARAIFAKPAVKECEKYSGIAAWKSLGYYDTNIARGVREQIKDSGGVKDKVQEASMKGAEWGDKLTWGALWNACKFAVKNEQPGLDHEALMQATAKKFRKVVYSTQVVDSTMTRSHNMRGRSIYGSMATAFMAEPTLSYNIVMDAVHEYQNEARRTNRQEAWKKTHGKVAKAFTVYCLSGIASAIAESLMDAFRDDDEYEEFYQKFLEAMFGEKGIKGRLNGNLANDLLIFNKLPLIKDALSLLSGYSTDRIDMEWMSNAIKAFGAIKEKIELDTGKLEKPTKTTYYGNMTWYGAVYLGLKTLSQATGLPVGSATREVVTLWNNTVGRMTGQKIVTYDSKPEKQIQKGFENGWLTEENAIRLLVDEGAAKDEDDAWFKVQKWSTGEGKFDAAADAMIAGDKKAFSAAVGNLTAHGVKQKGVESSMKSTINKLYVGTDEEPASISAEKAKKLLQDYVGMKADEAADLVKKWSAKIETGVAYGDRNDAYQDGDLTDQQYLNMVTKYGGKTQEDALQDLNEQKCLKQYGVEYGVKPVQQAIIDGDVTKEQAAKIWKDFGGKEDEEIEELLAAADFVKTHPTAKLETVTSHRVELFNIYAPKTMDGGVFMERAAELYKKLNAGDFPGYLNSKGKTAAFSVMDQVAQWVNSLPLTKQEKIAVFVTYSSSAENNIGRYNWS